MPVPLTRGTDFLVIMMMMMINVMVIMIMMELVVKMVTKKISS